MRALESRIFLERVLEQMAPGLGVPCCEAQADGVPCAELGMDCVRCGRGRVALLRWLEEAIADGRLESTALWDQMAPPEA